MSPCEPNKTFYSLRSCGVKSQSEEAVVLNGRALPIQREKVAGTRTIASLAKEGGVSKGTSLIWCGYSLGMLTLQQVVLGGELDRVNG